LRHPPDDDRAICNTKRACPITLEAKYVHHVTELHVRHAPTWDPARHGVHDA
jgi:hypothetical protein